MAQKKTGETFEKAMERLEEISLQMEKGDLPLEELVTAYEEGLRLVRLCGERLEAAEQRIQAITRNTAGVPVGLAPVENTEEIGPSTERGSSVTEGGTTSTKPQDPVRLF
jgi:exodeoxyribonuclease VII small subunit